jgi:hypothetical protein
VGVCVGILMAAVACPWWLMTVRFSVEMESASMGDEDTVAMSPPTVVDDDVGGAHEKREDEQEISRTHRR